MLRSANSGRGSKNVHSLVWLLKWKMASRLSPRSETAPGSSVAHAGHCGFGQNFKLGHAGLVANLHFHRVEARIQEGHQDVGHHGVAFTVGVDVAAAQAVSAVNPDVVNQRVGRHAFDSDGDGLAGASCLPG